MSKVKKSNSVFLHKASFHRIFFIKNISRPAMLCMLLGLSILVSYKAKAQDSTDTTEDDDETSITVVKGTEYGYDTTGYFFNKKYKNETYNERKITVRIPSDTVIEGLRNEDDFWYVKSIENFKKNAARLRYDRAYRDSLRKEDLLPPDEQVFTEERANNTWISNLIWFIIIAVFIGAIIYFLLSNKINLFSRRVIKAKGEEIASEDDLFSIDYDALLAKYIAEKNYRRAVRTLYLQLLKMMSEKEIITFQPQFTNTHYLQQLAGTRLYQVFFTVTHHYEYIWYGEFSLTNSAFERIKNDFSIMKKGVMES